MIDILLFISLCLPRTTHTHTVNMSLYSHAFSSNSNNINNTHQIYSKRLPPLYSNIIQRQHPHSRLYTKYNVMYFTIIYPTHLSSVMVIRVPHNPLPHPLPFHFHHHRAYSPGRMMTSYYYYYYYCYYYY
jgi:hypothetical protein